MPLSSKSIEDQSSKHPQIFIDQYGKKEGYVLDANLYQSGTSRLKNAPDGHTVLIPQPSIDPEDPLNWSQRKKNSFLLIISFAAFLPDYGSSTGAITNIPQPAQFDLPLITINHALVGNLAMLAIGGIVVVVLSSYFGRLPILFWFSSIALATSAWCAAATDFKSFETARILNGFFSTVAQAGGLMFIKDMFFFHEYPRKINIWSGFIVLSPYFGPFVASFIIWKATWPWAYWILTILWAIVWILIVVFMDETFYDRRIAPENQPRRKSRVARLIGIEQWRSRHQRIAFHHAVMRPVLTILKLPVLISSAYYVFSFAWVIGINATTGVLLQRVYHWGPEAIALYYFAPIVATAFGELAGHWLFDITATLYSRRYGGHIHPEARLVPIWLATPLMVLGIILLGFSLERAWHFMVTAVAWGLYVFGIMISTTAINAYVLDSYPEASGEVAVWINFGRTLGGFIITYFEVDWILSMGTEKALAIQAAILAAAFGFVIILQVFGKRMRVWQGKIEFGG